MNSKEKKIKMKKSQESLNPENLVMSEAHTPGLKVLARASLKVLRGGTLFLDEIGVLSVQSQVKLLRLIQEKEYRQLGSDAVMPCK
jgi:DNA-binding NtrC family response regulator